MVIVICIVWYLSGAVALWKFIQKEQGFLTYGDLFMVILGGLSGFIVVFVTLAVIHDDKIKRAFDKEITLSKRKKSYGRRD